MVALLVFYTAVAAALAHEDNTTGNEPKNCVFDLDGKPVVCGLSDATTLDKIDYSKPTLILKNSESLHLYPETHQNASYRELVSYQITDIADLEIEPKAFANLLDLRFMHIMNNNWTIVKNHTFYNLTKLKTLVIANDSVKEIQVDALRGLIQLDALEITNNQIAQLPVGLFSDLIAVTSLLLRYNELETLDDGIFKGLKSLKTLDLSHNKITVLKTADINMLEKLTHLYLGYNRISEVDGSFRGKRLGVIYFQNNNLRRVREDLFQTAPILRGIDISGNNITELSIAPFKNMRHLLYLNIQRNNISDVSEVKQLNALVTYK